MISCLGRTYTSAEEEEEEAALAAGHYGWMNYLLSCKKIIPSLCILI